MNDNFEDVRRGDAGELLVRGPTVFRYEAILSHVVCEFMGLTISRRYKNNPHESTTSFYDGWLRTGDILQVDDEGYYWLVGRKKEIIKYKGFV